MANQRERKKLETLLRERLTAFVEDARKRASTMPSRNDLSKRTRERDTATDLDWVNSPGVQPE